MLKFLVLFFAIFCVNTTVMQAQFEYTWEQFEADYLFNSNTTEDNGPIDAQRLHELHDSPMNVNAIGRSELEQLPFLDDEQITALLDYLQYNRPMLTLGELLMVWRIDRQTRCYLSLFLYCGEVPTAKPRRGDMWLKGKHEWSTRVAVPFYKRKGHRTELFDSEQFPTQAYLGNALYHNVKYRYTWQDRVTYGFQAEKDAGEPWAAYGNKPYDALSLFAMYRTAGRRNKYLFGDYRVNCGYGLAIGSGFALWKSAFVQSYRNPMSRVSPHASFSETDYLRGAVAEVNLSDRTKLLAFGSVKQADAILNAEGEVTSLMTTGLHRTMRDLERKHNLQQQTWGVHMTHGDMARRFIGGTLVYHHYDKPFARSDALYRQHYFSGQTGLNGSLVYGSKWGRWHFSGEAACDRHLHWATFNTVRWRITDDWRLTVAQRFYSYKYQSPLGKTIQEGSRVQNEQGWLVGLTAKPSKRILLTAYVDYFRFPWPTFTASQPSQGAEGMAQVQYEASAQWQWLVRLHAKSKQRNADGGLGWNSSRQLRLQADYVPQPTVGFHTTVDVKQYSTANNKTTWGFQLAERVNVRTSQWRLGGVVSLFLTDDYNSRLFLYEPHLKYAYGAVSLHDKGFFCTALGEWQLSARINIGAKMSIIHYLDLPHIGTGAQQISGKTKADATCQLRLVF